MYPLVGYEVAHFSKRALADITTIRIGDVLLVRLSVSDQVAQLREPPVTDVANERLSLLVYFRVGDEVLPQGEATLTDAALEVPFAHLMLYVASQALFAIEGSVANWAHVLGLIRVAFPVQVEL